MGWPFCSDLETWLKVQREAVRKAWSWQLQVRWAGQEEGQWFPHVLPTHDHPCQGLGGPWTAGRDSRASGGLGAVSSSIPVLLQLPVSIAAAFQTSSAFVLPSFHSMGFCFAVSTTE